MQPPWSFFGHGSWTLPCRWGWLPAPSCRPLPLFSFQSLAAVDLVKYLVSCWANVPHKWLTSAGSKI